MIKFHQGFFSETMPQFAGPVGCIWMDVDLESSARDVMSLVPGLPAESCVFSHEMPPEAFAGGELHPGRTEVLPPLVEAFTTSGRVPAGQHLAGLVGLIRSVGDGLPALSYEQIAPLEAAAKQ